MNCAEKLLDPQLLSFSFGYFDIILYGYIANREGVSFER